MSIQARHSNNVWIQRNNVWNIHIFENDATVTDKLKRKTESLTLLILL